MVDLRRLQQARQIRALRDMELLAQQSRLGAALRQQDIAETRQHEAGQKVEEAQAAWSEVLARGGLSPDLLRLNAMRVEKMLVGLAEASKQTETAVSRSQAERDLSMEAKARLDLAEHLNNVLEKRAALKRNARGDDALADQVTQRWGRP